MGGRHTPQHTLKNPPERTICRIKSAVAGSTAPCTLVTADEQYLRDSILLPNRQIAAGYEPLMPTFQGLVKPGDLRGLIAFIKSLQ